MKKQFKPLSSISFVICLLLLLLNDFYFKAYFHNFITGKLSDFSGLFVFAVFWATLFPGKKLFVFFSTALFFIYWKSPYSESFINFFSTHLFAIQRVVDVTDLMALLVLPVAWYMMERPSKQIYLNPWISGLVSLFSFCATTMPNTMQSFEQPQYVLFKGVSKIPDSNRYDYDLKIYPLDTLTVVGVTSIHIGPEPVKGDDFQKTKVLKDLDVLVQNELGNDSSYTKAQGIRQLQIAGEGYVDQLMFKDGRLHGQLMRKSNAGETLIDGQYKDGIEDSVWTIRDPGSSTVTKKTFKNGETVQVERYQSDRLISSHSVSTRSGTINFKYFQIILLLLIGLGMIVLIRRNYKNIYPEQVKMRVWQKVLLCFSLPLWVFCLSFLITLLIPDHFTTAFKFAVDLFFIYICTLPVFFLVVFGFKIRKSIDVLWYCILFALLYVTFWEIAQVARLKQGTEISTRG